ncbi:MAG TPA: hypothetical protein V6D47_00570 [Oscillatoriaceae cyanobacterium]
MTVAKTDVLASLSGYLPETDVEQLLAAAVDAAGLPACDAYAADEVSAIAQAILGLAGRELNAEAEPPPEPCVATPTVTRRTQP